MTEHPMALGEPATDDSPSRKVLEMVMANDSDWVADVKRWYFATQKQAVAAPSEADGADIGYEAAHPPLQSRHWPDAPRSGFAELS